MNEIILELQRIKNSGDLSDDLVERIEYITYIYIPLMYFRYKTDVIYSISISSQPNFSIYV